VVEASSVDAPVTPTLGLNTERVRVLATTGRQVLERIPAGPPLCAGEPIPEGFRCGFVRDRVEVVKEVDLEEDGK
jgi:hypothetical protein